jgi:NAD(P)-dependent dehydrogenase (short-subunit alcohol dehydrogenase family)
MAIERRAEETGRPREDIRAERAALVPMGHMGQAWDVANAAVFLASDEAKYITGALLPAPRLWRSEKRTTQLTPRSALLRRISNAGLWTRR